jgi:hypothetical protein
MLDRNPFRSGLLYPREGAGLDEIPGSKIARWPRPPSSAVYWSPKPSGMGAVGNGELGIRTPSYLPSHVVARVEGLCREVLPLPQAFRRVCGCPQAFATVQTQESRRLRSPHIRPHFEVAQRCVPRSLNTRFL